jgi:dUTP pyrophosphatase
MIVKIKSLKGTVPEYATSGSAGMDIRAYLIENVVLYPGQRALVPTGLFIELPQGYEAQIRPRSGLAVNNGIGMANGVGTVDSDYRGELKVPLINWGTESFLIQDGDRIAQMIIAKYERINWELVEDLEETVRGTGGFGHTGK